MARPCAEDHSPSPDTCPVCAWCADPSEKGRIYRQAWGVPEPAREPGLLRKAANLARAVVQHVAGGVKSASAELKEARLVICDGCPEFNGRKGTCRKCGCNMEVKAGWAEQQCPLGKWPADRSIPLLVAPPADAPPTNRVQVVATANGIGDAILALTTTEGLKRQGLDVTYVVKHWTRPWVSLFHGYDRLMVREEAGVRAVKPHDSYGKQMAEKTRKPRWEYYAERAGTKAALPGIKPLPRASVLWARQWAGRVVLAPQSTDDLRTWSLAHWLTLERELIARGMECVVIGGAAERGRTALFSSPKVLGETANRIGAVLHAATCVVANDSGMAHVAGMLRTPVVVMTASLPGKQIFGFYPLAHVIQGPLDCGNCHGRDRSDQGGPIRQQIGCQTICYNLQAITPQQVAEAVSDLVCWPARAHTLLTPDRLAVLRRAALETADVAGDMAELGVYRGGSALTIAAAAPGRTIHLYDTFQGLPTNDSPGGKHQRGEFACGLDQVQGLLTGRRVEYHPGLFPATAPPEATYSLVHIDADLEESTREAIRYFWPRLQPGGQLVFDDFGWRDCPGVERAIREVFSLDHIEDSALHQCKVTKPLVAPAVRGHPIGE